MQLDPETIRKLAQLTLQTKPDELSCDDWVHMVGEYVEATTRGESLDERQQLVARHAGDCVSCKRELDVLRDLLCDLPGETTDEPTDA